MRCVLVGVHFEGESHPVLLCDGGERLHRVGLDRDLHTSDREAELGGSLDLQGHVVDELVLREQAIAMDADVGVHGERRGHEADLFYEVAEPARERVLDRREAAEAGESDDFEPGSVPLGGDLADQPLEVVLAAVERAGEAVQGDALDGSAEAHAATAFMVLVSCSSMCSVSPSPMMMYGM
jgi:hypothetical protein